MKRETKPMHDLKVQTSEIENALIDDPQLLNSCWIEAVYLTADAIVADIRCSKSVLRWAHRKQCVSVFALFNVNVGCPFEVIPNSFILSPDRTKISFGGTSFAVSLVELLDLRKSALYFWRWQPKLARTIVLFGELVGCWRTNTGYSLLEHTGKCRKKIVWRSSCDVTGVLKWNYLSETSFEYARVADASGAALHETPFRYELAQFDGNTMILVFTKDEAEHPAGPSTELWKRAKLPKSWAKLIDD